LRAAEIFAAEDEWMRGETMRFEIGAELSARDLAAAPLALRRRVVRNWLEQMEIPEVGFAETERVLALLDTRTGPAKVNLPGGCHARRRAGKLFLERP
jgi:tRNA(Ile)-lysidine synthase